MVCPACIALPITLTAIAGSVSTKQLYLFQITLGLTFIGLILFIHFYYKKECQTCQEGFGEYISKIKEKYFEKI